MSIAALRDSKRYEYPPGIVPNAFVSEIDDATYAELFGDTRTLALEFAKPPVLACTTADALYRLQQEIFTDVYPPEEWTALTRKIIVGQFTGKYGVKVEEMRIAMKNHIVMHELQIKLFTNLFPTEEWEDRTREVTKGFFRYGAYNLQPKKARAAMQAYVAQEKRARLGG